MLFFLISEDTPIVHYGTDPSVMSVVKGNISKTYTADDMCAAPANSAQFVDPGFIHDVLLTNLEPGTRYYYSYGSEKVRVGFLELIYGYFSATVSQPQMKNTPNNQPNNYLLGRLLLLSRSN